MTALVEHLRLIEAGGQPVPYVGYVEVSFTHTVTAREAELSALALMVPECQCNSWLMLLVGLMFYYVYTSMKNQSF